ncbi:hypothetical protein EV360DRAFT_28305, partial [Lentinula raphanica]
LHIKKAYEVVQVQPTPPDRLRAHQRGDKDGGPKLVNTTLDWNGLSAAQMRNSKWNNALISRLAREAHRVYSLIPDGRFGKSQTRTKWKSSFKTRFTKFYKDI